MMGEPQLWRGELWRVQQLLDNLSLWLAHGYQKIEWVNASGSLRITTVDDRCTVLKDEFVWVRDGRLETGDIDDLAEAREKEKLAGTARRA